MTIEQSLRARARVAKRYASTTLGIAALIAISSCVTIPMVLAKLSALAKLPHDDILLYSIVISSVYSLMAVLLAIFAVGSLLHFAKYYTRAASHFDAVADSLVLAVNDSSKLKDFFEITSCRVPFGKAPPTPINELAILVDKLSKFNPSGHEK